MFYDAKNIGQVLYNQMKNIRIAELQKKMNDKYNVNIPPPPPGIHSKYDDMAPKGPNTKGPIIIPKGAGRNDGY